MGGFKHVSRGVQKIKSLVYTVLAISIIGPGITACTSDDGTSSPYQPMPTGFTNEFIFNYELLYYLYNDKDKYLDRPESYIGKVDTEKLVEEGYPWDYHDIYYMYAMMNDQFTYYVDPSRSIGLMNTLKNSEEKIDAGFTLDSAFIPNKYVIKTIIKSSPADKAGLKAGDVITEVEGVALTSDIVFQRLTVADEGDIITYTIQRDSTTKTIPVKIAPYFTPTVELSFKDSIPVIKIHEFVSKTSNDSGTYGEFTEYLRATEKYKTTIIDLRNNGGGDADQCLAMTQALLSKGDTAIGIIAAYADTIRQEQAFDTTFYVNDADGLAKNRYFVFLANEMTASCSEIMIAGVASNKKYPVIGATTYGKGIGQSRLFTPSLSLVSITSMRIIDKQKLSYHKYGIEPDFAIMDSDKAIEKAVALAKSQDFIRVAGYGTTNTGHFAKIAIEPDTMSGFYFLPKEYRKRFLDGRTDF